MANASALPFRRVSDGTRTRDRLDHNQELYQLSYAHQDEASLPAAGIDIGRRRARRIT